MKKLKSIFVLFVTSLLLFSFNGCGEAPEYDESDDGFRIFGYDSSGRALQVRFLSSNAADFIVRGGKYRVYMYGGGTNVPFAYQFEDDGDIDVLIDGVEYDLDSPYDIDPIKFKKNKKKIKKYSPASAKLAKKAKKAKKLSKKKAKKAKKIAKKKIKADKKLAKKKAKADKKLAKRKKKLAKKKAKQDKKKKKNSN